MLDLNSSRKVLIVNLGGIGDLLLAQPALADLKRQTGCILHLMAVKRAEELASRWGFIERFHTVDPDNILATIRKAAELRNQKYYIAVNMRTIHSGFSALKIRTLFKIIGPEITAGRNTEGRAGFFDIAVEEGEYDNVHEIDYCRMQIESLGVKASVDTPSIFLNKNDYNIVDNSGLRNYAVVHLGAAVETKKWPLNRYPSVIDHLFEKGLEGLVLTGTSEDKDAARYLKNRQGKNIIDMTGRASLMETAAFIARSSIFITPDTGIMHFGAALKVPMLVLFGPGDLNRYDPGRISENTRVLQGNVECSPCEKKSCRDMRCILGIEEETVIRTIDELIQ